jgi:hypothetical protein
MGSDMQDDVHHAPSACPLGPCARRLRQKV